MFATDMTNLRDFTLSALLVFHHYCIPGAEQQRKGNFPIHLNSDRTVPRDANMYYPFYTRVREEVYKRQ